MKISELLCDESKWCKRHFAVDAQGNSISYNSVNAAKWCLGGALLKCELSLPKLEEIIGRSVVAFNDDPLTTFQDVREVIRKYEN